MFKRLNYIYIYIYIKSEIIESVHILVCMCVRVWVCVSVCMCVCSYGIHQSHKTPWICAWILVWVRNYGRLAVAHGEGLTFSQHWSCPRKWNMLYNLPSNSQHTHQVSLPCLYIYINIYHESMPTTQIPLTISHHPPVLPIILGNSSRWHSVIA